MTTTGAFQQQSNSSGVCTSYNRSGVVGDPGDVCRAGTTISMYIHQAGSTPSIGEFCYTDSGCTTAFNGGSSWYKITGSASYGIEVDSGGEILDLVTC